jgi:predicted Zn-dependent peptidase
MNMDKERFELMPGVFLTVLSTDKFKTNCLSLNLLRPLEQSEAAMNALLPDVLLRGCALCPDMGAVSAWLDERYGAGIQTTVRKKGEVQAIGFFMDYINERYTQESLTEDICKLLGSFLLEPVLENGVFRKDYVAGEKVNLINAIMAQINDKRTYASIRLRQEMFRGEQYGVGKYGTQEQVEAITPERLYAHYQTILETSQIELTFAGQTDIEHLKASLLEALKELPRGALVHPETVEGPMPETVRELTETMDVTQGKLVMGFRTGITAGDEQYPALLLMNSVYGGSLTSKLFMNVREKLSLCYYASSGLDRFKGVMIVSSGVDMDKFETAKAEILAQLEACRRGEIAQEELEPARSYLISSLKAGEDSAYGMEDFYVGQTIGGYTDTPDTLAQALQKVTIPEIQAVANRLKLDTIYFLKGAE